MTNFAGKILQRSKISWTICPIPIRPFDYIVKAGQPARPETDPALGQFNVFDQVSFTADFNSMRNKQLEGFKTFNGKMQKDPNINCDEFLLAWILGNPGNRLDNISQVSQPANANLGDEMYKLEANPSGFIPNVLSVDFYERARVTDTAIEMNQRLIAP
jgi:hypothetical protein